MHTKCLTIVRCMIFGCMCAMAFANLAAAETADEIARDVDFIVRNAPPHDLPLDGDYVTNNCILAEQARATAPEQYPDEIFLEYVLPYSVIREERDDWRSEFRERFAPIVAGCTNAYQAAVTLDRTIWDMINVHYSVNRDKARQSPRHSMRIGMASCTGISIILIDACRALGIPARLVGCNWTTIPGNHSWVEIWSDGAWHVLASGEKEREDSIWFLEYAEKADASRPEFRIYACRWSLSPADTLFWRTWEHPSKVSDVPADDVTADYLPGGRAARKMAQPPPPQGGRGAQPHQSQPPPPQGVRGAQPPVVRKGAQPPQSPPSPPQGVRGAQPPKCTPSPPQGVRGAQPPKCPPSPPQGVRGAQPPVVRKEDQP